MSSQIINSCLKAPAISEPRYKETSWSHRSEPHSTYLRANTLTPKALTTWPISSPRHRSQGSLLDAYLQREHLLVYREKGSHSFGPGTKTSYIPTDALGGLDVVVRHFKVRTQKFYHFFIDCVFGELLWEENVKLCQNMYYMRYI